MNSRPARIPGLSSIDTSSTKNSALPIRERFLPSATRGPPGVSGFVIKAIPFTCRRIDKNGALLKDTTAFERVGNPLVCLNSWQPFEVDMYMAYWPSSQGSYLASVPNSSNWNISIHCANIDTQFFAIAFPATSATSFSGSLYFSGTVSDCGSAEHTVGAPMSLSDLWTDYFSWNILDSAQQTFPCIDKIIYCPPGYGSSTTIASTTTFSGSTTIGSGYNVNGSAYAALDFHVSAEAGFLGNGVSANAFDLSAKIGFNYNVNSSSANTYNFSRSAAQEFTTNGQDIILTEERTINSLLVQRRRLSYVLDTVPFSSKDSTDTAKNCFFIANIPVAVSPMQPYAMSAFLSAYSNQPDVLKNFWSLYAKDTATGKLKFHGPLIEQNHSITQGVPKAGSKTIETSSTYSQSFNWSAGPFAELCVEVAGVGAGGSISAMFSNSNESSLTSDTTNVISYQYTVPFAWDQIHTDIYEDSIFGSRLYAVDSATSFTTNPREKQTRPSVTFSYALQKPAKITVNQPATYTLKITNNSDTANTLLKTYTPEFDNFRVSDALSSVYGNLISFLPNDIVIPHDSTVSIQVAVSSVPDTLPLVIWAPYGYRNKQNTYFQPSFDSISSAQATRVRPAGNTGAKPQWALRFANNQIAYSLAQPAPVTLRLYKMNGAAALSVRKAMQSAGTYTIGDQLRALARGIYLCQFHAGTYRTERTIVLN